MVKEIVSESQVQYATERHLEKTELGIPVFMNKLVKYRAALKVMSFKE